MARSHTETALKTLAHVMRNNESPPAARVAAANSLLDRGWGKPKQTVANDEESGPFEIVFRHVNLDDDD